jgi:hypothetical protein
VIENCPSVDEKKATPHGEHDGELWIRDYAKRTDEQKPFTKIVYAEGIL